MKTTTTTALKMMCMIERSLAVEGQKIRQNQVQLKQASRSTSSTMNLSNNLLIRILMLQIMAIVFLVSRHLVAGEQAQQARNANFPGVSRDLASFCAARPSLPIDLAAMIVHVKKNISFNYKLYLFSADHVFQTGQVIPRDDFRIHSFPVKLKSLNEFWPANVATRQSVGPSLEDSVPVESSQFNLKHFFKAVPLIPPQIVGRLPKLSLQKRKRDRIRSLNNSKSPRSAAHEELAAELNSAGLPGDTSFISHDVARVIEARYARNQSDKRDNLNEHIRFDRDDQLSVARRFYSAEYLAPPTGDASSANTAAHSSAAAGDSGELESDMNESGEVSSDVPRQLDNSKFHGDYAADAIVPVGSFSSFHVNETYLVRKDFDHSQAQLVRIQIDANQFSVSELLLISNGSSHQLSGNSNYPQHEDYSFLSHKLLRDPNTRITSINQIYEDWITRNFYTIVYVQRRLEATNGLENNEHLIVNDRLVFRGTSIALLGADQLDYNVKASAFITEKNGLHYYLEFLTTGKFYLCAVDWTKRPFKMIDSARFPIKATKTQLDNEELLLCPPAVCYSNQPIDEIVNYGRILLPERIQKEAQILSKSLFTSPASPVTLFNVKTLSSSDESDGSPALTPLNETTLIYNNMQQRQKELLASSRLRSRQVSTEPLVDDSISLDSVIEAVKAGSAQLQTRLHLRDWVWTLPRRRRQIFATGDGNISANRELSASKAQLTAPTTTTTTGANNNTASFEWRHELARRNDIKVKPDTYGYVLTGHEIDASYRVYNELYLVSANHLITINYTMFNETVISTHPIGDEFLGLSSTLLDPITGAFYDRYANQIYFFKGDRYIGYDYASKKALSEFVLDSPIDPLDLAGYSSDTSNGANPLVSSLPVVEILGRQHQVDAVYHDFFTDLVHIFTGMKFYTFAADEFKNGSFRPNMRGLPKMYCINERFLHGCNFDAAYKNPCRSDEDAKQSANKSAKLEAEPDSKSNDNSSSTKFDSTNDLNFSDEQQMKLRSIASRAGLLNILVENTLLNKGAARAISPLIDVAGSSPAGPTQSLSPTNDNDNPSQGKIVVYLLAAMIVLTVLVTVAMILVIINWTRVKLANNNQIGQQVRAEERVESQPGRQYLSNQQHHSRNHQSNHNTSRHTSRSSSNQLDRNVSVKPLKSVSVVKSSRRQGTINNSVL